MMKKNLRSSILCMALFVGLFGVSEVIAQVPESGRIHRGWGDLGEERSRVLPQEAARTLKIRAPVDQEGLPGFVRVSGEKVEKMSTLLSSDFEGSFPSNVWTAFSQGLSDVAWGRSTFRSSSGNGSAWCAQTGSDAPAPGSDVPVNTTSWMIAGPFDLSSASNGEIAFDLWLETEEDFDFFSVGASLDGTNFVSFGSDQSTLGWQRFTLGLNSWGSLGDLTANSQVWFSFIYDSDSSFAFEGAYLDNVALTTNTSGGGSGLNLLVNQIDAGSCPEIEAIVSVTDDQGNPITLLNVNNFTVQEDTQVQTFSVETAGAGGNSLAVTLVLDGSGSLNDADVANIKVASNTFIDLLTTIDRIAVYHFGSNVSLIQDYTTNRPAARAAVNSLTDNLGLTSLYDAIAEAAVHSLVVGGRKALIVMTDGQDTASANSLQSAIAAAQNAGVPVFTIGFGNADAQVLGAIASQTGGVFFQGASSADLQTILGIIGQTLNNQYILTWTSAARDGGSHDVTVQVQNQGASASQTVSYSQANTPCATGGAACVEGPNTMCLRQGRFRVEVVWTDLAGNQGLGSVASCGTPDSGLFWFFDPSNWEMLIKVINGCGFNNRYWVFFAATTNLGYRLTVTDTLTNVQRVYTNPPGTPAPAVTDNMAFATCP